MSMLAHLLIAKSILEDANDNSDKRMYLTEGSSLLLLHYNLIMLDCSSCFETVDSHTRHVQPLDLSAERERDGGL